MEVSTETWRVKHPKNWLLQTNERNYGNDVKEDDPIRRKEATLCFLCKKSKSRSKSRSASVQSLAASLNENCCLCVGAFARYIKEIFRCLYYVAFCQIPRMEFEKLFCDWLEATGYACRDLVFLIRKIFHCCVGSNNK